MSDTQTDFQPETSNGGEIEQAAGQEAFEVVEMEFDEKDIVGYIEDEEGNELGILVMEDGVEVEYYYDADAVYEDVELPKPAVAESKAKPKKASLSDEMEDLGVTRDGIQEATDNANAAYREGAAVVGELKGAMDDIKNCLDFKDMFKF